MAPGPGISARVTVSPGWIRMYGFTFQPWPRSLAAWNALAWLGLSLSSGVAIPPLPFSPVKFSGLMERVLALDSLYRLPIFISRPLKVFCANDPIKKRQALAKRDIFLFMT